MTDQLVKQEGTLSAIQTLRLLFTIDGDEGLAIAKSGVKDGFKGLAVRGMSVLQRWNEMRFGESLLRELEAMKEAGRIREDFNKTDAGVASVREFFEFIDGKPDEERFQAFCALFMSANSPDTSENESLLDLELMGILRGLSAGEMHLLSALMKLHAYTVEMNGNLVARIGEELGHNTYTLIHRQVKALLDNGLIDKQAWMQPGGPVGSRKELLTDLGEALLKRVDAYKDFKTNQNSAKEEATASKAT